ncbi:MAG TPA: hypothetical protein DCM23_00430 [Firmicutes bacterium]|nr:hypothetical protein [Bacillota bacterium]
MGVNQGKQFNYEKRSTLENLLNQGKGAKEIAGIFLMDPTSIAREIKRNREVLASMFRWIFWGSHIKVGRSSSYWESQTYPSFCFMGAKPPSKPRSSPCLAIWKDGWESKASKPSFRRS